MYEFEVGTWENLRFITGKAEHMNKRQFHKMIKDLDRLRRMPTKDARMMTIYNQVNGLIWWENAGKTMEFAPFQQCAQATMRALNVGKSLVEAGEVFMVTAKLLGAR